MFDGKERVGRAPVAILMVVMMAASAALSISASVPEYREYYLLTFSGLPTDEYKAALSSVRGVNFLEYAQGNTYLVSMPTSSGDVLASSPYIDGLRAYGPGDKLTPELRGLHGVTPLRINLHPDADLAPAAMAISELGGKVTKLCSNLVNYIECDIDAGAIAQIAEIRTVNSIWPNAEKQTFMSLITSNTYTGVDAAQAGGFTGSGMLAQVQDNGCDADIIVGSGLGHQDLDGIIYTDGSPVEDDHGTCTSGIVFGNGAGDINAQGIAYQAVGSFADWGTGRTTSVTNLWNGNFQQGSAGMNGVMQSNSWSQGTLDGTYTTYPAEDDAAAVAYPKVLTLWAAGNSNSGTGVGLITQDSANKNGMCIGAIFHENTASMADDNYHDAGSGMTPSRGPAADGRMKPDLIAAFDWIYTVDQVGASGYVSGDYYDDFGGTSGATPTVAGCSLLAYEMYQENFFDNNPTNEIPYSATIKALMIADAYQYPLGTNSITRNVEGWGTPDMENMYNRGADYHVFEEHPQAMSSGSVWSRTVYSDGSMSLKISLAWTDPAAPATTGSGVALINNLDLRVVSPTGTVYWGNNGLWDNLYSTSGTGVNTWSTTSSYRDDKNNVENVFIQNPGAGIWTIEVTGRTGGVPSGPQDFSLVASGAQGISGVGTIALDQSEYQVEDTAQIIVQDLDLNVNPGLVETVNVNVASNSEPAGETRTLTETGPDTSTFAGTVTLSATNSVGVLQVANGNTVTATYNDADAGGAGPATATDTALVDGAPPGPPSGLAVTWDGLTINTLVSQDFSGAYPPTGWSEDDASGNWNQAATANAGGTSPEARFNYVSQTSIWRLKCGPLNTAGLTSLALQWNNYYDDYGAGVTVRIQTATSTSGPWTNSGWSITSGTGSVGPGIQTTTLTSNVGSGTFYFAFVVDGNAYQLDYWYIDNVLLTYGVPNTDDNRLDWDLSVDDGAGADDVVKYVIYRSNAQAGPWDAAHEIDEVAPGTDTYTDTGRGEFDGTNWWYLVRAEDNVGNRDSNTNAIPEIPTANLAPSAPNTPTPSNGATGVSVDPTLQVRVSDPNGDTMTVRFYNAAGPVLIGTVPGVASGTYANCDWFGRSPLTTYNWYATADDGEFVTQSSTWSFTTLDTTPPGPPTGLTVTWFGTASGTAIDEDFSGGIPATWTVVDGGAGGGAAATWTTANPGGRAGVAPITTPFAIVDSDNAGSSATQDEQLITPVMNLGSATAVTLEFDQYFYYYTGGLAEVGDVDVRSANTGGTWTNVFRNSGTSSPNPNHQTIDITAEAAGAADAQVRFYYYNGQYEWYWMVDNVLITFDGGSTTDDNLLSWTFSPDDGAGANDVVQYNIYRSDLSTGPWDAGHLIDVVPAGTATYQDIGRGEFDGINWWYVVRAEDVWGNEDSNVNAVPEIGTSPDPYEISLTGISAGSWVFVSFPSGLAGNIQDILTDLGTGGDGSTTWSIAKWYNPQTPADPWKTYRFGGTANDMPTVTNAMGFWLYITANGGDQLLTLASYVAVPASTGIQLYAGWNLVGYPSMTSTTGATLPAAVDILSVYSGSAAYTDYFGAAMDPIAITHGKAYFIHCSTDATWTVNNP